jgi:hypothetical protein
MHTATSGPMIIFFVTVVTVIVPALVLAGVVIIAARDSIEARREREIQGSPNGTNVQSSESRAQSLPTSAFGVSRWYQLHKTQS